MTATHLSIGDFMRHAEQRFTAAGVENAGLDARLLIAHVLEIDRAQLLAQHNRALTEAETESLEASVIRRIAREPIARIKGSREFWGLTFSLNGSTLEPRPDSETLIEAVLKSIAAAGTASAEISGGSLAKNWRILDIGTGSGCLLLSLLKELPNASGVGIDLAATAIDAAKANAEALGLAKRSSFLQRNWLDGVLETFDIIVSNPPYIKTNEIENLMPEVRLYDPFLALDGGEDGLSAYRHLIPSIFSRLIEGGLLALEIGEGQRASVSALIDLAGFEKAMGFCDLSGIDRCMTARKPKF